MSMTYNLFYIYGKANKDKPEIKCSQAIFILKIKENNAKEICNSARQRYDSMLSDYMYKNAKLSKQDVESQQRHYYNCKEIWEDALEQLKQGLDEEQAVRLGYQIDFVPKDKSK